MSTNRQVKQEIPPDNRPIWGRPLLGNERSFLQPSKSSEFGVLDVTVKEPTYHRISTHPMQELAHTELEHSPPMALPPPGNEHDISDLSYSTLLQHTPSPSVHSSGQAHDQSSSDGGFYDVDISTHPMQELAQTGVEHSPPMVLPPPENEHEISNPSYSTLFQHTPSPSVQSSGQTHDQSSSDGGFYDMDISTHPMQELAQTGVEHSPPPGNEHEISNPSYSTLLQPTSSPFVQSSGQTHDQSSSDGGIYDVDILFDPDQHNIFYEGVHYRLVNASATEQSTTGQVEEQAHPLTIFAPSVNTSSGFTSALHNMQWGQHGPVDPHPVQNLSGHNGQMTAPQPDVPMTDLFGSVPESTPSYGTDIQY